MLSCRGHPPPPSSRKPSQFLNWPPPGWGPRRSNSSSRPTIPSARLCFCRRVDVFNRDISEVLKELAACLGGAECHSCKRTSDSQMKWGAPRMSSALTAEAVSTRSDPGSASCIRVCVTPAHASVKIHSCEFPCGSGSHGSLTDPWHSHLA